MNKNAYRQGKKQVNVLLSQVLHRHLLQRSAETGESMQEIITAAVRQHLGLPLETEPLWGALEEADLKPFEDVPLFPTVVSEPFEESA